MDALLNSDLPWQLKAIICLGPALVLSIIILAVPKRVLARISRVRCCSPNWVTIWRLVLFWFGAAIHFSMSPFWGFQLIVAACVMDRVDGKMAKAMAEAGIARSIRDAQIGEWIDPLIDKLTILPLLCIFGARGCLHLAIAVLIALADIPGTLMREPFGIGASYVRAARSSAIGKVKVMFQVATLFACMPVELDWIRSRAVPNTIGIIALVLGVASLLSRLRLHRDVEEIVEEANAAFTHDDE